jgi:hypothetical protein
VKSRSEQHEGNRRRKSSTITVHGDFIRQWKIKTMDDEARKVEFMTAPDCSIGKEKQ